MSNPNAPALRGLAVNPAAPPDVLRRLVAEGDRELAPWVLSRASLPGEAVEALAAHPDTAVRRAAAESPVLSVGQRALFAGDARASVRLALVDGPYRALDEPAPARLPVDVARSLVADEAVLVRRAAVTYSGLPVEVAREVAASTDPGHRQAAVQFQWSKLPPVVQEALRNDEVAEVRSVAWEQTDRGSLPWVRRALDAGHGPDGFARWCDLDRALAEELATDPRPYARAAVAENPGLAPDLVQRLAVDDDPGVRLAVSVRRELSEAQRARIDYTVSPEGRYPVVSWVARNHDDAELMRMCARSAHVLLRRSAATARELPRDVVRTLAADTEDFAVRLLLCQFNDDAPAELLREIAFTWRHRNRRNLVDRPNFPRDGLRFLAGAEDPFARSLVASDPHATPDLIERLSHDPAPHVRSTMAADARLPLPRLLHLLREPDAAIWALNSQCGAATNPSLPADVMHDVLDQARTARRDDSASR